MLNYSQQCEAPADWERVPGEESCVSGQRPADGEGEPQGRHHGPRGGAQGKDGRARLQKGQACRHWDREVSSIVMKKDDKLTSI